MTLAGGSLRRAPNTETVIPSIGNTHGVRLSASPPPNRNRNHQGPPRANAAFTWSADGNRPVNQLQVRASTPPEAASADDGDQPGGGPQPGAVVSVIASATGAGSEVAPAGGGAP